jgi:8-oxo-dGTP pyrophosphatase MutT (NUDIX family)
MTDPFAGVPADDLAYFRRMAKEFTAAGRPPSVPRVAATVVIRRADGKVLLIRRAMGMVFGGRWAFPGGSVDPADAAPTELQRAANAAIREVREETALEVQDLIPWSRWITPEFEPRRFDTYFFVAQIDSRGDVVANEEAADHRWITPADAVAGYLAGELPMLPPTAVTLRELSGLASIEEIREAAEDRDLAIPVLPVAPPEAPTAPPEM